jgi:hypothetical protein
MKHDLINLKNIILLVLITVLLYYLIIYHNNDNINNNTKTNKSIKLKETMLDSNLGNLEFDYSSGLLHKRINRKIENNFDNFKIEIVDNYKDVENTFNLFNNIEHVGNIRYFPYELKDNKSWLKCDGREYTAKTYPELFKLLVENRPITNLDKVKVPNLIGKIIFGMRQKINPDNGTADYSISDINEHTGPYRSMNKLNNSKAYNGLEGIDDSIAIHQVDNAKFSVGDRDGISSCPLDEYTIAFKADDNSDDDGKSVKVCVDGYPLFNRIKVPNYPPYINLYPYIKAKTLNYKIKIPILDL